LRKDNPPGAMYASGETTEGASSLAPPPLPPPPSPPHDEGEAAPARPRRRFKIKEIVGSGSFGTVFKAADRLLDRMVAVKKITVHTGSAVSIKRCLRELTILRLCR